MASTPAGKVGASWLNTVSGVVPLSAARTGATMTQVGQSRLTKATNPSGRGEMLTRRTLDLGLEAARSHVHAHRPGRDADVDAAGRRRVAIVASDRHPDVVLAGTDGMRGVEAGPAGARDPGLGPRVRCPFHDAAG